VRDSFLNNPKAQQIVQPDLLGHGRFRKSVLHQEPVDVSIVCAMEPASRLTLR
jgi:hypothetical protein